jgi:hypothetical protein
MNQQSEIRPLLVDLLLLPTLATELRQRLQEPDENELAAPVRTSFPLSSLVSNPCSLDTSTIGGIKARN